MSLTLAAGSCRVTSVIVPLNGYLWSSHSELTLQLVFGDDARCNLYWTGTGNNRQGDCAVIYHIFTAVGVGMGCW